MAASSIGGTKVGQDASAAVESREQILQTTGRAMADYLPAGSGLGSFRKVYRLYESPGTVTNEYVIHAHNDYAELALELGVPGVILMALFLAWWAGAAWAVFGRSEGSPFGRAAAIASAALLPSAGRWLSEVRMEATGIATTARAATATSRLAQRRWVTRSADLRPTRHIVIG
jgi:O-antigen ligase